MTYYRVTYKNTWSEIKTIVIPGDSYWEILRDSQMMFGKDNVISVEEVGGGVIKPSYTAFDWYDDDSSI